ncbi:MAG: SDR family oxidoreductase [Alphaproteobacteria bacterium]|nr:SDR family oxidoreductase [Alphaproteobacteria bacterium]
MIRQSMVAIVTGAAGGIGGAVAEALAREKARLMLLDSRPCDDIAANVRSLGGEALVRALDVRQSAQVQAAVEATLAAFGRIDVLVTAAGVISSGPAESITEEEWQRVIGINLTGTWLCCQAVLPIMRRQRQGRIVTLGSLVAMNGGNARPWVDRREIERASNAAYGASKGAVHALTMFLAKDLAGDGVTVNAVAPGPVATPMLANYPESLKQLIPIGRMMTAAEVADAILFLARPESAAITGQILDINGGMMMG